MKKFAFLGLAFVSLVGVALTSLGQNTPAPVAPPAATDTAPLQEVMPDGATQTVAPDAPNLPPEMSDPLLEGFFEDIGYSPTDRRDPFLPYLNAAQRMAQGPEIPLEPLQKFALNQLKLIGIIWDVGKPKALIEDPGGRSHIIVENTKLGQELGYVAAIREGEIIVVEQSMNPEGKKLFQTKVLKLSSLKK